jgi:hypothetical protein
MDIANGSMLDEATSAAEAVTLAKRSVKSKSNTLIVAGDVHPQTIEVIQTRCAPLGIDVKVGMAPALMAENDYFAVVCQYPSTTGLIHDLKAFTEQAHAKQAAFIVCADLLALTLLTSPGEFGADIVVGNTQRFGMPMGQAQGRVARTRPSWPARTSSSARCPAASSACPRTPRATRPCAWPCKLASSTSAARRPRPTSAPRRCCRPSWPACTPSTTARRASSASPSAWPATRPSCTPA